MSDTRSLAVVKEDAKRVCDTLHRAVHPEISRDTKDWRADRVRAAAPGKQLTRAIRQPVEDHSA